MIADTKEDTKGISAFFCSTKRTFYELMLVRTIIVADRQRGNMEKKREI